MPGIKAPECKEIHMYLNHPELNYKDVNVLLGEFVTALQDLSIQTHQIDLMLT